MAFIRKHSASPLIALSLLLSCAPLQAADFPSWLPCYDVELDLDVAGRRVHAILKATWTNPTTTPTQELVFNAHSRYVVPSGEVGLTAKTLELLRVNAGTTLGVKDPPLIINKIT